MSFPLFFDEMVHAGLAEALSKLGFDVLTTRAAGRDNRRISDEDQLQFAASTGRALVTYNGRDFIPLAQAWDRVGRHHAGIILCNPRSAWELIPRFLRLVELYPDGYPPNLCARLPDLS